MNQLTHLLKRCLPKLATGCLLTPILFLASCSSTKNSNATASTGEYPSDGAYHPYTQSSGGSSGSSSHYQEYSPGNNNSNAPGYQPQSADGRSYADNGSDSPPPKKKKKKKTTHTDPDDVASSSSSHTKSSSSSTTHKSSSSSSSSGNYRSHIIKHGDTYYSLAKKYHTSVATLKRINGRSSDTLKDGEKIKIPAKKSDS